MLEKLTKQGSNSNEKSGIDLVPSFSSRPNRFAYEVVVAEYDALLIKFCTEDEYTAAATSFLTGSFLIGSDVVILTGSFSTSSQILRSVERATTSQ